MKLLEQQLARRINCPMTSSMGRLFDVVASMSGIRQRVGYEAQAAIECEALASRWFASHTLDGITSHYEFEWQPDRGAASFRSLLDQMRRDVLAGQDAGYMSAAFHAAVVSLMVRWAEWAVKSVTPDCRAIALTGGVFQNALLLDMLVERLTALGIEPLIHRIVPPNDGGLALGQAWLGMHALAESSECSEGPLRSS